MSATQIRQELHQFIDLADDRLVSAVHSMMHLLIKDDQSIVAFTGAGKPLTQSEFVARVQAAYDEAKKGKTVSTESLLADMETW